MLRINVIGSVGQAKSYFRDHLLKGDYYAKDQAQEVPSIWAGKAAERMGLSGEVTKEDFYALIDHQNPTTGEPLTSRKKDNRRQGYDLTFSAPKSVSVYHMKTGDDRVLSAFRESVQETMEEMESEVKVRVRQKGENGERVTGNALWSGFLHQETRPVDGVPDPHLHEHVVLHNVTWDEDYKNRDGSLGRWMAAEIGDLKRNAPYHQAAFDARLASKLSEMGLAIRHGEKGSFELAGFHQELKETFSRRTVLIEKRAEELGIEYPEDKAELGAKTREAKVKNLSRSELLAEWNTRLTQREWRAFLSRAESGNSPQRISAEDSLDHGVNHCLERQSVARRTEVLTEALKRGVGSVTPEQVKEAFSQRKDLISAQDQGQTLVTTEGVLEEEQSMIRFAREGRGSARPLGSPQFEIQPILRDGDSFELNRQQRTAVQTILSSRSKVILVRGAAGTGKTSLMAEAIRGIEENAKNVHVFAPTSDATDVLRKDGEESRISALKEANTVAKLLQSPKLQSQMKGQVILIDEAGLMSTKDMKQVFDVAEKQNARVILSGDYKQHASVVRGDAMRILVEQAGLKPAEVTEVHRQRNRTYKAAVESLSRGTRQDVAAGFDRLDQMGLIQQVSDPEERNEKLAAGYVQTVQSGQTALVVSPTHAEGGRVTEKIRDRLKSEGLLAESDRTFTRLVNRNLTEAEKANPYAYEAGHIVQFHKPSEVVPSSKMEIETVLGMGPHGPTVHQQFEKNSRTTRVGYNWKNETGLERVVPVKKGLTYGTRATVLGRDRQQNVHVQTESGEIVRLPLSEAAKFSVYESADLSVAAGESIRITQNGYTKPKSPKEQKHRLTNGAIHRVAGFTRAGDIRLENGWVVDQNNGHFTHGYVTTSHASQGKTRDVVFVAQSAESFPASNMAQWYVSVSRAKQATVVMTDDKRALRNQAILRSSERMAASELAGRSESRKSRASEEQAERQQSFMNRLQSAARGARELARRKAKQIKAYIEKKREQSQQREQEGWQHES